MSTEMFLILLFSFSVITGLITESIKKIVNEKENLAYNIVALIVALFVGGIGTGIYYYLNNVAFSGKNIVYLFLLCIASALVAELGYDKVKEAIMQILNKRDK